MKKKCLIGNRFKREKVLFVLLLLLNNFLLSAQDLDAYHVKPAGSVTFNQKLEVPPWIIPGGWRSYFFVDGTKSRVGSTPNDLIHYDTIRVGTNITSAPDGCTAANMFPWRRNYYAIYSAQYIDHPAAGPVSLGFLHGENLSVVGSDQPAVSCGGIGWDSYAGFVCGSWIPNTAATNWGQQYFSNDLGALVWPSTGYFLSNGQKSSLGVRHPSSIIASDGYLYLFYKDESHYVVPGHPDFPSEAGRGGGIKVARVPVNDALDPHAYKCFFEDSAGIHWNPSLPAGFTKELTTTYLYVQGPRSTNVMGAETEGHKEYNRFSVARVRGTDYYFGIASYQDYDDTWTDARGNHIAKLKVSLRYSYDLVHWFGNRIIDVASDWTTTKFNYPIFLSSDGWWNTEIDAENFYVLGTAPRPGGIYKTVYRMQLYLPGHEQQITGILDESPEEAPRVFPNPGRGEFYLRYTLNAHVLTQIKVMNIHGRLLYTGPALMRAPGRVKEQLNISKLSRGIYLLVLTVNEKRRTLKVVFE